MNIDEIWPSTPPETREARAKMVELVLRRMPASALMYVFRYHDQGGDTAMVTVRVGKEHPINRWIRGEGPCPLDWRTELQAAAVVLGL